MFEAMNKVHYDEDSKEYVLVTNGRCRLDHSNAEAFARSHANGTPNASASMLLCEYAPSEAIAIRTFVDANGTVSVHWTYRRVRPEALGMVDRQEEWRSMFDAVLRGRGRRKARFGGRI